MSKRALCDSGKERLSCAQTVKDLKKVAVEAINVLESV